jgi:hypothetical protein
VLFSEVDAVAQALYMLLSKSERKEVRIMRIATSFLAALLLAGSVGANNTFAAADGVVSNATLTPGSYCHLKFPAIREDTLASNRPVLEDPSSGDIVDFYGSCNEDPRGMDQVQEQKLEAQHRWARDYGD